ncbi:MAG: hypothetical protein JO244_03250 [Solirubrobacterales bacterium]|nr:hypothetical protein [Solirubrobacterales bacterium]
MDREGHMVGKRIVIAAAVAAAAFIGLPAAGAATATTVPHFDHVFTIVLENENLAATWHTPGTYLNGLLARGTFASQYYGASHVSADNYVAMTSGQMPTPLFQSDCVVWQSCEQWEAARPDGGVSITNQLDAAGKSWKAYMDGMGAPCVHGPASLTTPDPHQTGYATRHDPFVYYPPVAGNAGYCAAHVVDYSQLATDLASEATTPNYVFITPDTCHDGHDAPCTGAEAGQPGGLASANAWMSTEVPRILGSPAFTTPGVSSLLLVTTDEAANTDATGCATGPLANGGTPGTCASGVPPLGIDGGGLVGLLAIGSHVAPGGSTTTPYDHVSMFRTVEDALGLGPLANPLVAQDTAGHLNEGGSPLEHSMTDLFTA